MSPTVTMSTQINILHALTAMCILSMGFSVETQAFTVDNCDKDVPGVLASLGQVSISGCSQDTSDASCTLERGKNKSISLDFTPNSRIESIKTKIFGKVGGLPLPFPLHPDEACGNYGLGCPLQAGQAARFQLELPVLKQYPKLKINIVLELKDENKKPIVCISFPATISDPPKTAASDS